MAKMTRYNIKLILYFLFQCVSVCLCTFCLEPSICSSICSTTETYKTSCGYMFLDVCEAYRKINTPCEVPCNKTVCCYGYIGEDCATHTCFNETTCDNGGTCVDVDLCACLPGFRSPTCSDIDECNEKVSGCDHICHNSAGSYRCSCGAGFILATDEHTCHDKDECTDGTSLCDHLCHNKPGYFNCSCREGYTLYSSNEGNTVQGSADNQLIQHPPHKCVRSDLFQPLTELDRCLDDEFCTETGLILVLGNVSFKTSTSHQQDANTILAGRDIILIVDGIQKIVHATAGGNRTYNNTKIADNIIQVASNLLDNGLELQWKSLKNLPEKEDYDAVELVQTVGNYSEVIMNNLTQPISIADKNIALDIQPITNCSEGILFPADPHGSAIKQSITVYLGCQRDMGTAYSGIIYRNISQLMDVKFDEKRDENNNSREENEAEGYNRDGNEYKMGSNLVTFTLGSHRSHLDPPVQITFKLDEVHKLGDSVLCVFIDNSNGTKHWSSRGCNVIKIENDTVFCECNHLTNFAILVNPGHVPEEQRSELSILSLFGCSVTMLGSLVTLLVYIMFWRSLRSTRATLLMHLCAVIFLAYLLFVVAETFKASKLQCTLAAVGQHYLFLLMFFIMLAEGFYLANRVLLPHSVDSIVKILLPAYGIPAVIVGISVGATKAQGYGNRSFCWLTAESGLIWSFFGPVLLIIAINIVIVCLVLRRMYGTNALQKKSEKQRILTGIRSVCVMVPVTGLTWLMGLFTLVQGAVIFQYLFVFFNTLQGLFILIFHCLLNEQVKSAVRKSYRRMKSLTETSSDFTSKKQTSMRKKLGTASSNVESSENLESASFVNKAYISPNPSMKIPKY